MCADDFDSKSDDFFDLGTDSKACVLEPIVSRSSGVGKSDGKKSVPRVGTPTCMESLSETKVEEKGSTLPLQLKLKQGYLYGRPPDQVDPQAWYLAKLASLPQHMHDVRSQLMAVTGSKSTGRRKGGYGDGVANKVYRFVVSDSVGVTANGSGNTIGSQGLDPSGWTSFSVYQDLFGWYRIRRAEYRIVTAGANVATVPQTLVIAWDPAATSLTPGSQQILWMFPKSKVLQLSTASGIAKDSRQFDYGTAVVPEQDWFDLTTPTVQKGCLGYYGDGATVSVQSWVMYIRYHVEFRGLVTP